MGKLSLGLGILHIWRDRDCFQERKSKYHYQCLCNGCGTRTRTWGAGWEAPKPPPTWLEEEEAQKGHREVLGIFTELGQCFNKSNSSAWRAQIQGDAREFDLWGSQRGLLPLPESRKTVPLSHHAKPAQLTVAAEKEETRVLAGVTLCGRRRKWLYRGRSTPGFIPTSGAAMLS